jgi:hypothetical protein
VHIGTDTVSTTVPAPGVGNWNGWISEYSIGQTENPLNWTIEDDTGGVIGGKTLSGDTLDITFSATMSAPVPLFSEGAVLTLRSTYLNVDLNDGDAPDGTLQVTNAQTGQVLLSDATFSSDGSTGDNCSLEIALPNSNAAGLTLGYYSDYGTAPVGPFSAPTDDYGQDASFGWTLQASVTSNDVREAGHGTPVSSQLSLADPSTGALVGVIPPSPVHPMMLPARPSSSSGLLADLLSPLPARNLVNDALPKTKSIGALSVDE